MHKRLFSLVVIACTALVLSGCAAKDEKMAHGDAAGEVIVIGAGDFFEACDQWQPGEKVNVAYTSSAPVMFDVHYHQEHAKAYAVDRTLADSFTGSFVVQSPDIHCCMWKNDNPESVTLTYNMSVE